MIKYGLISETDARTIEKTIDLINDEFNVGLISICEVGVYGGNTGMGICEYVKSKGVSYWTTGIDNLQCKEMLMFSYQKMIYGNSSEVYNQIEDNSQHLIFIDGCHAFPYVISDFFCYADKVKAGGYMAFHDTGAHIKQFTGYQDVGSKDDADMYISVRKALNKLELLDDDFNNNSTVSYDKQELDNWKLIFDEADINNEMGGICVFKKLY